MVSAAIWFIVGYVIGGMVNVGFLIAFCLRKMSRRGK